MQHGFSKAWGLKLWSLGSVLRLKGSGFVDLGFDPGALNPIPTSLAVVSTDFWNPCSNFAEFSVGLGV